MAKKLQKDKTTESSGGQLQSDASILADPLTPVVSKRDSVSDHAAVEIVQNKPEDTVDETPEVELPASAHDEFAADSSSDAPGGSQTVEQPLPTRQESDDPMVMTPKRARSSRLLLAFLALAVIAGGAYGVKQYVSSAGNQTTERDLASLVAQKAVVPADERPTISTVIDETQVNQPFLSNARKDDKVLLYFKSQQAIVYRPSTGQIVNMGPLETPKPRVFVRDGRAGQIPASLVARIAAQNDFLVVSRDASSKQNYAKTLVVDIAGNRPDLAGQLAARIDGTVAELPAGESRPDADLLVIVGSDAR